MAKTKAAVSKKNNSLSNKKYSLKSRKVQFFVTVLVVAILGGGWLTYKSFAANLFTWTYSTFKCATTATTCHAVTDGGKGSSYVLELSASGSTKGSLYTTPVTFPFGTPYRICVTAKGAGYLTLSGPSYLGQLFPPPQGNIAVSDQNNYVRHCTSQFTLSGSKTVSQGGTIFSVDFYAGNPIRISSLDIDTTPAGTTPVK